MNMQQKYNICSGFLQKRASNRAGESQITPALIRLSVVF